MQSHNRRLDEESIGGIKAGTLYCSKTKKGVNPSYVLDLIIEIYRLKSELRKARLNSTRSAV